MARNTATRKPVSTSAVMIRPSSTTRPIASAQDIWDATATARKALSPRPVASAIGIRPTTPITIVTTAATSAVTPATCSRPSTRPSASAAVPMISGLSTTMYAIVMKVTSPPRTSRRTVEPRAVILKYRSSRPPPGRVIVATGASLAYVSEPANPPSEDVAGRDVPDTPPPADPPAGADEAGARPAAAAELAEPEPPIALRPPNARPTPPPLEADTVRIVIVGTTLWFLG